MYLKSLLVTKQRHDFVFFVCFPVTVYGLTVSIEGQRYMHVRRFLPFRVFQGPVAGTMLEYTSPPLGPNRIFLRGRFAINVHFCACGHSCDLQARLLHPPPPLGNDTARPVHDGITFQRVPLNFTRRQDAFSGPSGLRQARFGEITGLC